MTVDEVIAQNVRRVREDRGLTVAQLADRLSVGRHLVYDYERPRPGAEQRQFLWSDLVRLCDALEVTLFELVLPPAGKTVKAGGVVYLGKAARAATGEDSRSRLGWLLFGVDGGKLDSKTLSTLAATRSQEYEKVQKALIEEVKRAMRAFGLDEHIEEVEE